MAAGDRKHPSRGPDTRYRQVMQALLRRDYLKAPSWDDAVADLARMACEAVDAGEALVALWKDGRWSAVTSRGRRLRDGDISAVASHSVLDKVLASGEAFLSADGVLPVDSKSVRQHALVSVVAVPIHLWIDASEKRIAGCLYAHRTVRDGVFTKDDVELIRDVTEVAERTLNVLHRLGGVMTELERSRRELEELQRAAGTEVGFGSLVTRDGAFARKVLAPLARVARAPKIALLILGPTGSGKSHLARAYHEECSRKAGPFVVLDCAQITSEQTLAAELFGFAPRSGFANAPEQGRPGAAQLAHGGTLFIDEVTAIPPGLQQKLLALVETGHYTPLGASEKRHVDIQVIAAANESPQALVKEGRFREDLLWRLSEMVVELPSLSARPADIEPLAVKLLQASRERFGRQDVEGFTREALRRLARHDWASCGNIRGLGHAVGRSVLLAPEGTRLLDEAQLELPSGTTGAAPSTAPEPPVATSPEGALAALLGERIRAHHGDLTALAADPVVKEKLGTRGRLPVSTLRLRLRKLGLAEAVEAARQERRTAEGRDAPDLETLRAALRQHGNGADAARALGISRDVLVWRLRAAGLTLRKALAGP